MNSRVALGSVQFGMPYGIANKKGQTSFEETVLILENAWNAGINTLDTAIVYGESEQRLGEIGVKQWRVITKLPIIQDTCPDIVEWIKKSVHESLLRLRLSRLYGLLFHNPKQLLENQGEAIYSTIENIKKQGLIQKIGVSIYNPDELELLLERFQLDIIQSPYNILDRRLETSGWLTRLQKTNIKVHTRSTFLQGLLLMDSMPKNPYFERWNYLWEIWRHWLDEHSYSPLEVCLNFSLCNPAIDRVIIGVDSSTQLNEILSSVETNVNSFPSEFRTNDVNLINPTNWIL